MWLLHDRVRPQRSFDIHGDSIRCKAADQDAVLLHLPAAVANPDWAKIDQHGMVGWSDPAAAKRLNCDPGAGADPNAPSDQQQGTAAHQPIGCQHGALSPDSSWVPLYTATRRGNMGYASHCGD